MADATEQVAQGSDRPIRLEWIEAGSLAENPHNWRRHPPSQLRALSDLIHDPAVGWAGVLLFNERTGHLIDGHARKAAAQADELVPVLVGNWSPEAEKKILATLDPLAALAGGDSDAYDELTRGLDVDSLFVRDVIDGVAQVLRGEQDDDGDDGDGERHEHTVPELEMQPFEHYDYIVLVFRDNQDFSRACELLDIGRRAYPVRDSFTKVGLGRIVDGAKALEKLCGS